MENIDRQIGMQEEEPMITLSDVWNLIWGHKWW